MIDHALKALASLFIIVNDARNQLGTCHNIRLMVVPTYECACGQAITYQLVSVKKQ